MCVFQLLLPEALLQKSDKRNPFGVRKNKSETIRIPHKN